MPRIVTRAEWGARAPKTPFTHVPLSARSATCIHHDGPTPITISTFAEAVAQVRADEAYHIIHNGWAGIGYNFLVISAAGTDVDGVIFEGRGRDMVGAHCLNWNTPWIGIQVAIGGGQTPSPKALTSTRWLHDWFEAAAGRSLSKKVHSDGFNTACPDPKLRAWVKAGMPTTPLEDDMPLTQADADLVVKRLLGTEVSPGLVVKTVLQRAAAASPTIDTAALVAAIVALIPNGVALSEQDVSAAAEAAIRKVLGTLDGAS